MSNVINKRPYVVGINGLARAGKDTAVSLALTMFEKHLWLSGCTGRRYAFADELKDMYASFTRVPEGGIDEWVKANVPEHLYQDCVLFFRGLRSSSPDLNVPYRREDDQDKVKHRPNLIKIGLFFRSLDVDFWVDKVDVRIKADNPTFAFITDVRFLNEVGIVDYLAYISRVGVTPVYKEDGSVDPSEQLAVSKNILYDYHIHNDGDLSYLEQELMPFVLSVYKHAQRTHI
jgi:hypothetical protein